MIREDFHSLGEFLVAVAGAAQNPHSAWDRRLEFAAAATGLGEKVPAEGGFTVPHQFAADLWSATYNTGALMALCGRQPVTHADGISIPAFDERSRADGSRWGGVRVFWADEGIQGTPTKPTYRQINLIPNKLLGISYATNELLGDAPALAAVLERGFRSEAAFVIEEGIVSGSGAGHPLGILNSGAAITVAAQGGQISGSVVGANITDMLKRLWVGSRKSAVWLVNGDVESQLPAMGVPYVKYGDDGLARVLGKPVIPLEQCPALGSVGDIILCDPSQYLLAEQTPDFLSSIHVKFLSDEGVFRLRWRIDGQPAWLQPVTPLNSASTQSPFVTLAARP